MGGKRRIKEKGDWEENERDNRFQNFLLLISAAAGVRKSDWLDHNE